MSRHVGLDKLSAEAKKLAELAGHDGDVSALLKKHPELFAGLDEYMKWRDMQQRMISAQEEAPQHGHPLAELVKKKTKQ